MLCRECKFMEPNRDDDEHGWCNISLPSWLQKRENDNGRMVWIGEYSSDGCDLGQPKEQK